jgi:dipeptidyl aminopeptidase/acylaminoacyl peptidase
MDLKNISTALLYVVSILTIFKTEAQQPQAPTESKATINKETQSPPASTKTEAAPHFNGFDSSEIIYKGDILPFFDYDSWLGDIQKNAQRLAAVDDFTRAINPIKYNNWRPKIEAQWIEYQSDGLKISGAMLFPKDSEAEQKLPVLIYNRGGNAQTPLTRVSITNTPMAFAARGYIVLASNYRGSHFSEGKDEFGGADVNDVLRLIEIAKTIPKADANRIAMMGWSRGSQMTYQALRANHKDIKVAIIGAGVTDNFAHLTRRPGMEKNIYEQYVPDFKNNREQALQKRSALFWADEISPGTPILLLHGTSDWRVDVSNSLSIAKKFDELHHVYKLVTYPHGDHGLTFYKDQYQQEIFAWLEQHLK